MQQDEGRGGESYFYFLSHLSKQYISKCNFVGLSIVIGGSSLSPAVQFLLVCLLCTGKSDVQLLLNPR